MPVFQPDAHHLEAPTAKVALQKPSNPPEADSSRFHSLSLSILAPQFSVRDRIQASSIQGLGFESRVQGARRHEGLDRHKRVLGSPTVASGVLFRKPAMSKPRCFCWIASFHRKPGTVNRRCSFSSSLPRLKWSSQVSTGSLALSTGDVLSHRPYPA